MDRNNIKKQSFLTKYISRLYVNFKESSQNATLLFFISFYISINEYNIDN